MTANGKRILGLCLLATGLGLCCVGLWNLLSPPTYRAVARIKLERAQVTADQQSQTYNPYFNQTEFEVLQSELILGKVVEALDLKIKWGRKHAASRPLETSEAIALLKRQIDLCLVRGTGLMEVCATSEVPDEAAKIANAIVMTYRDYHLEKLKQLTLKSIRVLEGRFMEQEQKVNVLKENVERLKKELNIPETETDDVLQAKYKSYWEAKKELEEANKVFVKLKLTIESERIDLQPLKTVVSIIDRATLPSSPISPNRPLGVTILVLGLVMIGVGLRLKVRTG